ncbi:MAG TPA: nitronate monooxygenase [Rhizomicrobium sp.]|nr:nitronate monooxygenase [Rhizomicrobium sp.]
MKPLHTPVCDLFGCDVPVMLAGMGGPSRSELVAAVTEAGGFGFLGMVRESPRRIQTEIERVRARTSRNFGVNLIPAATPPDELIGELQIVLELKPFAVALFWDVAPAVIKRLRDAGILVVHQVGSASEAEEAQRAGAQVLIAQGIEAGGHVRATKPLFETLAEVLAVANVPVLASGGIANGKDVAAVLRRGAQGAVLGTAFLATTESFAHDYHKQRIVDSREGETVRTQLFHINWPEGAYVRVLENSVTRGEHGDAFDGRREVIGQEKSRPIHLFSTDSPLRNMAGDYEAMALYAGIGSAKIDDIVPAAERLERIVNEAADALDAAAEFENIEPASPVCYEGKT